MPEDPSGKGPKNLTPQETQKRLLWLSLIVGAVALILGGMQIQHSLTNPFRVVLLPNNVNSSAEDQNLQALKAKDTDKDGLSDYDELYVYHTSPYIADSDSDGTSDSKEVQAGTDPNCPDNVPGKPCGITTSNQNTNTSGNGNTNSGLSASDQSLAAELRQSLIAAGVPQSELDGVDDRTLLQQYQSVLAEQDTNSETNTNTAATNEPNVNLNGITSTDELLVLDASQVRQLLIANGVPAATLNSYDDATLLQIYRNALQEAQSNSNTNA